MTTIRVLIGVRAYFPKTIDWWVVTATLGRRQSPSDRAALLDFFVAKDWALNTNLPRGNVYANIKVWPNLGLS